MGGATSSSAAGVGKGASSSAPGVGTGASSSAAGIGKGASASASGVGKGATAPEPPPPRPPRTNFGRLVETLGKTSLYEDNKNGRHISYIITCGRHLNAGENPAHVECKKYCSFGTGGRSEVLPPEECIRRLKRWYVRGEYGVGWPADRLRSEYIGSAGPRCRNMSSDMPQWSAITDEQLDEMVSRIK